MHDLQLLFLEISNFSSKVSSFEWSNSFTPKWTQGLALWSRAPAPSADHASRAPSRRPCPPSTPLAGPTSSVATPSPLSTPQTLLARAGHPWRCRHAQPRAPPVVLHRAIQVEAVASKSCSPPPILGHARARVQVFPSAIGARRQAAAAAHHGCRRRVIHLSRRIRHRLSGPPPPQDAPKLLELSSEPHWASARRRSASHRRRAHGPHAHNWRRSTQTDPRHQP
jgi:hypothetical protein